jgi:hypothetical protein
MSLRACLRMRSDEPMEAIQSMIETITVTPREGGGLHALLHRDLARILALSAAGSVAGLGMSRQQEAPALVALGGLLKLVAGTRNLLELLLLWSEFHV